MKGSYLNGTLSQGIWTENGIYGFGATPEQTQLTQWLKGLSNFCIYLGSKTRNQNLWSHE